MAYTKQTWQDLPSKTTPINATRLAHIEDGIFNAAQTADTAASTAGTAAANVGIVSSRVETLTERVNGLDTAVSNKVDKVAGKGLSTNDYDNTDKSKVDALGTASTKNSTSVVTDSTDLVESGAVYTALQTKADNSVIGTVEDGATASQAYAVGEHFIRSGKLCTCKADTAQGEPWTLNTNYVKGALGDFIIKTYKKTEIFIAAASYSDTIAIPVITGYVPVFVTSSVSGTGATVNGYAITAYDSITSMVNGIKVINKSSVEHTWNVVFNVMYVKSNTITVTSLDS